MDRLGEEGILKGLNEDQDENTVIPQADARDRGGKYERELKRNPWFEEIIEGSELGKIRWRKGGEQSADGRTRVKWEVVEFEADETDPGSNTPGKRKLDSLGEGIDVSMRNV